jgi:hypothetical protein
MCIPVYIPPSDGKIYKYMSYAFEYTYSISSVYTFVAAQRKIAAITSGVNHVRNLHIHQLHVKTPIFVLKSQCLTNLKPSYDYDCTYHIYVSGKLSELEVRKEYQLTISNRFAALEDLNVSEDINGAWENNEENIKLSAKETLGLHEWTQHKPWFDEECSQFLGKSKQAKIQCLQNPNQSNGDNLNNIRCEASRHFRNKKKEYLKAKTNELETNSKNKNIRLVLQYQGL